MHAHANELDRIIFVAAGKREAVPSKADIHRVIDVKHVTSLIFVQQNQAEYFSVMWVERNGAALYQQTTSFENRFAPNDSRATSAAKTDSRTAQEEALERRPLIKS